jgi:Fe-S cluster assembly protein SufD
MVSLQIAKDNFYKKAFDEFVANKAKTNWLTRLREIAFDRFEQLGFPTPHEEEWKYTNVAPITKETFDVSFEEIKVDVDKFVYDEAKQSRLVFVDGIFDAVNANVSSLADGVVALNLKDALNDEKFEAKIKEHLARVVDYNENAFTALNTAFVNDGVFLHIPKNTKIENPIQLLFISTEGRAVFPRVLMIVERGSEATIIENYVGNDKYFTSTVVEIILEDDARLTHYRVQRESEKAFHVGTTKAELNRGSNYNNTNINLGASLSRHDVKVRFNQTGAEARVDGLYLVSDSQHSDTHSVIDHTVPHCTSRQLYKGILDGKGRAVFNGKVFVRENANGTDAQQTNKNLLLSNDARVDTKPQLEIFNDDVKCSHGATVGQLEDEELFYLLSRGLHPDLAKNLLTYGFAEEVVDKIQIKSIKQQLDDAVLSSLHTTLEA